MAGGEKREGGHKKIAGRIHKNKAQYEHIWKEMYSEMNEFAQLMSLTNYNKIAFIETKLFIWLH